MFLTDRDIAELTAFRHALHRAPEVSGAEAGTAAAVAAMLGATDPDRLVVGLGGHGVAAVYRGAAPGPVVMLRCELDGLPIEDLSAVPHRSQTAGVGHQCGHDGHMATLMALSRGLARRRPARGTAVLLFQPAEETGAGAAAVLADPKFAALAPDYAFAMHNMPGLPLGTAALAEGPANCASQGLRLVFTGRTSHASAPEAGVSPGPALARLIPGLTALGPGGAVEPGFRLVTVTHARMGEPAFGIAPGHAELWLTLRTLMDADMAALHAAAVGMAQAEARAAGLQLEISAHDVFAACANHPEATAILRDAIAAEGLPVTSEGVPMRASEDFGRFGAGAKAAMFLLGAGEDHPRLHNPDYDFPDSLIPTGGNVMMRALRGLLGDADPS